MSYDHYHYYINTTDVDGDDIAYNRYQDQRPTTVAMSYDHHHYYIHTTDVDGDDIANNRYQDQRPTTIVMPQHLHHVVTVVHLMEKIRRSVGQPYAISTAKLDDRLENVKASPSRTHADTMLRKPCSVTGRLTFPSIRKSLPEPPTLGLGGHGGSKPTARQIELERQRFQLTILDRLTFSSITGTTTTALAIAAAADILQRRCARQPVSDGYAELRLAIASCQSPEARPECRKRRQQSPGESGNTIHGEF